MCRGLILKSNKELQALIDATGLSYPTLGSLLDANPKVVMAWYTGNRKPRHPAMLRRALQLIVLEQRGIITAKLIDAAALRTVSIISQNQSDSHSLSMDGEKND